MEASLWNLACFIKKDDQMSRVDYHCISNDPKHDTCLWPSTFNAVIVELLARYPNTHHFEVTTDTSKKEFKMCLVFQRVATIANSLQKTFKLCTFGLEHRKYLYNSVGSLWVNKYSGKCVATLNGNAKDLETFARTMNTFHGKHLRVLIVQ